MRDPGPPLLVAMVVLLLMVVAAVSQGHENPVLHRHNCLETPLREVEKARKFRERHHPPLPLAQIPKSEQVKRLLCHLKGDL